MASRSGRQVQNALFEGHVIASKDMRVPLEVPDVSAVLNSAPFSPH